MLDRQRVEYWIEKPSNKLLTMAELDSDTWLGEVKRIRGKRLPLTAAGVHALRDEYTRSVEPARTLAAETPTLERTLSDLVNQAYGLTPAEVELLWKTAPRWLPSRLGLCAWTWAKVRSWSPREISAPPSRRLSIVRLSPAF